MALLEASIQPTLEGAFSAEGIHATIARLINADGYFLPAVQDMPWPSTRNDSTPSRHIRSTTHQMRSSLVNSVRRSIWQLDVL